MAVNGDMTAREPLADCGNNLFNLVRQRATVSIT